VRKFARFLLPLFLIAPVFAAPQDLKPPGTDLIPERRFNFVGGMEDHTSPFLTDEAKSIVNFSLSQRGQLTKRTGYAFNAALSSSPVTGGGYHLAQTGTSFLAVVSGTGVYKTSNVFGGSFTDVTNGITLTNSASNLVQSDSLNDYRVFCNETDAPFKISASASAAALTGAPTGAKTCASFFNYLFFGNTTESGTSYPSRLRWSDVNTVDSWPTNNYIDLGYNDGDSIVDIAVAWRYLLIFKKRSIYAASITGLSGANAFIARPIARGIGCWAKNSVQVIRDHGVFWQGADGIYQMTGFDYFGNPQIHRISEPIWNEFLKINKTQFAQSTSAKSGKYTQYWLAIATGSLTTNSEILVYDYHLGDTNQHKAWTTYAGINANALIQVEDNNNQNWIFSGDTTGGVYKHDVGNSDNPSNKSTAITASYTSQDIVLGSPDLDKQLKWIYTFLGTDISTTTVTMNVAYDYSPAYADTFTLNAGANGALWKVAIWGTDYWGGASTKWARNEINRSGIKAFRVQYVNSSNATNVSLLGYVPIYKPEAWSE